MKLNIVSGKVRCVKGNNVLIYFKSLRKFGVCSFDNLTDYKENIPKLSRAGSIKKFCDLGKTNDLGYAIFSYKFIHPEEISRKSKTIPTASHFLNLYRYVNKHANLPNKEENIKVISFCELDD